MSRAVFHLSLPARDLEATRRFYCGLLGGVPGRVGEGWIDLVVFGHQLTFHQRPEQVVPEEAQGVQHFGAILDWDEWQALGATIEAANQAFALPPTIYAAGTDGEHGKLLLRDPSGHLLELKAYRRLATVIPGAGDA